MQGSEPPPSGGRRVLAIDPGSAKCGVAVVQEDGTILARAIAPTERLIEQVRAWIATYAPERLLLGAGTGSKPLQRQLEQANLPLPLHRVPEAHTSEAARARYLAEHPPRGWQRLLPRTLRTPPEPYDDYVAVLLAERYWRSPSDLPDIE